MYIKCSSQQTDLQKIIRKTLDGHDFLTKILALSHHLKSLYVAVKDLVVSLAGLDENTFHANEHLETIQIEMHILEIKV